MVMVVKLRLWDLLSYSALSELVAVLQLLATEQIAFVNEINQEGDQCNSDPGSNGGD